MLSDFTINTEVLCKQRLIIINIKHRYFKNECETFKFFSHANLTNHRSHIDCKCLPKRRDE